MKQWKATMIAGALAAVMTIASTATVFAAQASGTFGAYNVVEHDGYAITMETADGTKTDAYTGEIAGDIGAVYDGAQKLSLTFDGTAGEQYVVFLLHEATPSAENTTPIPTQANLKYIDQKTGAASMTFDIYPSTLQQTGRYHIFISSSEDSYASAGFFDVTASWTEADYIRGNPTFSGKVSVNDALAIRRYLVSSIDFTITQANAANVIGNDASVDVNDAIRVVQYLANLVQEL